MAVDRSDLADTAELAAARGLWAEHRLDAALAAFDRALAAAPRNIRAHLEAARAYGQRHDVTRAEALLTRAEALGGADPEVAAAIAQSYGRIFREETALARLEALAAGPGLAAPMEAERAALLETRGRLEEALAALDRAALAAPDAPEPKLARGRILRRLGRAAAAEAALAPLTTAPVPALAAEAWTELSYLRDRAGDAEGAVAAIDRAHALLRALPGTPALLARARATNAAITSLAEGLDRARLARWEAAAPAPLPAGGVAHLVGFPRSGTTLLERALDAHPGVVASPERLVFSRDIFPDLCRAGGGPLTLATLDAIPAATLKRARRRYLALMEGALGERVGPRVHIDKNPNHTGLLPGLLRLLPESRVIVALRDPRDVVASCVLRSFRRTEFSAMLLDWGTAAELYAAEMGAWLRCREALAPERWVEIRYEDVVADLEGQARRAVSALGVPWDPAVLRYREGLPGRAVHSPTQWEVRAPVHAGAIGRWRGYRRHLEPHLGVLAPYVQAFGYAP